MSKFQYHSRRYNLTNMHTLTFRQGDQARIDPAAIEFDFEVISEQLARLPTRRASWDRAPHHIRDDDDDRDRERMRLVRSEIIREKCLWNKEF